jgi:hypothetical protein
MKTKNTKGLGMILVGVIIALVAVGGIAIYNAGQDSVSEITLHDSDLELVDHLENFDEVETVEPYNPLVAEEECLTVDNITEGQTVTFPLEITGTIEYGCWGIFEGEAGFAHIEQNEQVLSFASVESGLVQMTSGYYTQADYPAGFTATIPSVTGGVSGPANLVITERGDLGENGNSNPDQIIIPIVIGQWSGVVQEWPSIPVDLPEPYIIVHQGVWPPASVELNSYSCVESESELGTVVERSINGKTYCVDTHTEHATGTAYSTYTFTGVNGVEVRSLTFTLRYSNCNGYFGTEPQYTDCQSTQSNFDLDDIVDMIIWYL